MEKNKRENAEITGIDPPQKADLESIYAAQTRKGCNFFIDSKKDIHNDNSV